MANLTRAIDRSCAARDRAIAVSLLDAEISYADLRERADCVATRLAAAGVAPGDRVAVGLPNAADLVAAVVGCLRRGAIVVPLNPLYSADEVLYVVADSGARAAFVHQAHAETLRNANRVDVALLDPAACSQPDRAAAVASADAAPALIVYTSGTTGRPKGVVLSQHALATNLQTVADAWGWTAADRLLLTLPCFHLHGLGLGILASLMVGSTILLRARFEAATVLADLSASRATMFFGVPTMYNRIVTLPDDSTRNANLAHMRLWVSGSAPLSAATFERFRERFGAEILERYGMTECGFVLSSPLAGPRRPGAVGRVLPGVECLLVDSDAADRGAIVTVEHGAVGEILVRGPNLFTGYWQRAEATRAMLLQDYLRSGDLAFQDAEGLFRIVGRKSVDIIKTRGFKVGAGEIEDCLLRHPSVAEVAVVGIADADQGQRIVAAVTPRDGATVSADELCAFARAHLAPHKVPSRIVFYAEIPKTGPGKFKKVEIVRQLESA